MTCDQPQWTAHEPFSSIRPEWRVNAPYWPEDAALTQQFGKYGILGATPHEALVTLLYRGKEPDELLRERMVSFGITTVVANLSRYWEPRLTAADVRDVRAAVLRGQSIVNLARRYGVNRTTIAKAVHGDPPYDRPLSANGANGGAR